MNELLPVGSVITIKNKKSKYIIIGEKISYNDNEYDYVCVEYPYGLSLPEKNQYINDDEIDEVFFYGSTN